MTRTQEILTIQRGLQRQRSDLGNALQRITETSIKAKKDLGAAQQTRDQIIKALDDAKDSLGTALVTADEAMDDLRIDVMHEAAQGDRNAIDTIEICATGSTTRSLERRETIQKEAQYVIGDLAR